MPGIEFAQLVFGDRSSELDGRLGERRPQVRTHRAPSVVVYRAVSEHLEVLGLMPCGGVGIVEGIPEADAFYRGLRDAPNLLRRIDTQAFQHGRRHVNGVRELLADFA